MRVTCSNCKTDRAADEMGRSANRPQGLHSWCRSCLRNRARADRKKPAPEIQARRNLWTRYRMTDDAFRAMLTKQGGLCAICRGPMARICVDHDHLFGHVRGLLCHPCNIKLHSLDSWSHLRSALAYLNQEVA